MALSRPAPGPVTRTSTERTPCSLACSAQLAAASWAAKGVPLREPLKPMRPAEDQASTPPSWSAIAMIVFLRLNGLAPTFTEDALVELVMRVASGACTKAEAAIAIAENVEPIG